MTRITGSYYETAVADERVQAFVPKPLPPAEPPLALDEVMAGLLRRAEAALSRLGIASAMVPSLDWFLYAFVRKEAVLSSQIEGTQATLVDLFEFEAKEASKRDEDDLDVREVCNYVDALEYVRSELNRDGGLPLSLRLLHEAHERLMQGARGARQTPGEVRRTQNWIGGARPGTASFVPPPAHLLPDLLGDLERYVHAESELPPLIRVALIHVQFETIHPYLDGNGRIGRLLISILLEEWGLLDRPMLYLSLFFKSRRDEYYRRLGAVREDGDWEGWVRFFLEGVEAVADEAVEMARKMFGLVAADRERVLGAVSASVSSARLFELLPSHPVVSVTGAMALLGATRPTAASAVEALVATGVLVETSGKRRNRVYRYEAYLEVLRVGTEL